VNGLGQVHGEPDSVYGGIPGYHYQWLYKATLLGGPHLVYLISNRPCVSDQQPFSQAIRHMTRTWEALSDLDKSSNFEITSD